jgi:hypothetical protein
MKTEWITYLESIGIEGLFLERAEKVIDFYQQLYPDQIEDIFVTEYLDKDGNRQYESVWLFSNTGAMEAKAFLKKDDFDFASLKQQVKYWNIKKTEYDFCKATNKSRMILDFELLTGILCALKASRENCDYLKALLFKHIIPNAIDLPNAAQQMSPGDS